MKTSTDRCPECGKKFFFYDSRQYFYGSPLKTCKKCGKNYIDRRYHEIAVEGIPGDTFSKKAYALMSGIGALILWRGIYLTKFRLLGAGEVSRWFLPVVFITIGLVMIIGGIVEIILISSGRKAEKFERLKFESEERLRDRSYAWTLKQEGYNVSEQYL